jgi:hypothetical protein
MLRSRCDCGRAESAKGRVLFPVATAQNPRLSRFGIVKDADPWHAAEVNDGAEDPGEERHLVLAKRNASKEPATVAQSCDEQIHFDE